MFDLFFGKRIIPELSDELYCIIQILTAYHYNVNIHVYETHILEKLYLGYIQNPKTIRDENTDLVSIAVDLEAGKKICIQEERNNKVSAETKETYLFTSEATTKDKEASNEILTLQKSNAEEFTDENILQVNIELIY